MSDPKASPAAVAAASPIDPSLVAQGGAPIPSDPPSAGLVSGSAASEAALLPEAGRLILPVEIIRLSPPDAGGGPARIVRTITGRKVRLPSGRYLVQTVIPTPDGGGTSTIAEKVDLKPGDDYALDLSAMILESAQALLAAAGGVVAGAAREVGPALVRTSTTVVDRIDEVVPGARQVVRDAATTMLAALVEGIGDGVGGREPEGVPAASMAGWIRAEAREVAAAATEAASSLASLFDRSLAQGRGLVRWISNNGADMLAGAADGGPGANADAGGTGGQDQPSDARGEHLRRVDPGSSFASSRATTAPLIGDQYKLRVVSNVLSFGSASQPQPADAALGGALGALSGKPFLVEINDDRHAIAVDGPGGTTIVCVPVDVSGPTRVLVSMPALNDAPFSTLAAMRPPLRIALGFSDLAVDSMWGFVAAGAFDEARQLAIAYAGQVAPPDLGAAGTRVPLTLLLSAYVLLRANDSENLAAVLGPLRPFAERCSDIRIIDAEHRARSGLHGEAVQLLLAPSLTTLPVLRSGATYAMHRLRLYERIVSDKTQGGDAAERLGLDGGLAEALSRALDDFSAVVGAADQSQTNLILLPETTATGGGGRPPPA